MKDQELLKAYYEEHVKEFFDPAFDQLTNNQITRLKNSIGFAKWKFAKTKQPLSALIKKAVSFK